MNDEAEADRPREWLIGGGLAGNVIRTRDWSATPLGPRSEWPVAMRTALGILLSSPAPGFMLWGGPILLHNDAAAALMAAPRPDMQGLPLPESWPEAWVLLSPMATRVFQGGEATSLDGIALPGQDDAADRRFTLSCTPLLGETGRVEGLFASLAETTPPVRVAVPLLEAVPHLVWRSAAGGRWLWSGSLWSAFTGQSEAESRGFGWLDALHPDDRQAALAAWGRADAGEGFEVEFRLLDVSQGHYRWFQSRATPLRQDGQVEEWLGTSTDVDRLRQAERRQGILLSELQHRVRNTLSVIRSIIRRTVQTAESTEDLAMHLDGRINAFARVQGALSRDPSAGLELAQLIADELLAHAAREDKQVTMEGPPVQLRPKVAETLGLAVHELTSNSVKYGALSAPEGQIVVTWRLQGPPGERSLELTWKESGGPPVRQPRRRGFGTDLLERTLPYDLKAEVRQDFHEAGLCCHISLPCAEWVTRGQAP
ncbi:PAS domain S-box-containing protein [Roseomonas rosea]|uniref:histidine kinase n=1 Tax=Muricoccus roseus TaxID=198092 RepID=A0A1M6D6J6_9PROT|nr:HWE histidine kinase domain-containing protein [Roseomonas rosea]SHI68847.1 PAS domain S-box-containing protein [Roseomonas rosea]